MKTAARLSLLIIFGLLTLPAYSGEKASPSDTTKTVKEANPPNASTQKPAPEASKAATTGSTPTQESANPLVQFCRENPC